MSKPRVFSPARIALALSLLAVTCCQTPEPPPPAPAPAPPPPPAPTPQPGPPPAQNWIDRPQTPGDWSYGTGYGGTLAQFSDRGTTRFAIACDNQRNILLIRPQEPGPEMMIRTETTQRILTGTPVNGALIARLAPNDPLLDAMAITRGRFAVEVTGAPGLYVPAWAEVTRVVEDCR
ncbi:hypothetical protein I5L01_04655 [Erythrobacter sp. YJ-T3-07]|uniref:hypothetical protein n=1 Tax=Erythrobacter sp. YJ-T3-07 TaxID=2793063 RepID=UPI0018D3F3C2|nr:hypothetical protein [Erythrobacter sp. YJ-T3-07]MBH1943519.1 hypothetical protein [Erythrobacter sp. YJ-T3-07]